MSKVNQLIAFVAIMLMGFGDYVWAEQAPAEGRLDFRDISAWLPGQYDNEPQRHFLEGMKRANDAPARRHARIKALADQGVYLFTEFSGDEHAKSTKKFRWRFLVDDVSNRVSSQLVPSDSKGKALAGVSACTIAWSRQIGAFSGQPQSDCSAANAPLGISANGRLLLGEDELWVKTPATPVENKFYKATTFDCFIAVRGRDGKPQAFTELKLHDRGGSATVKTTDQPARELTLKLRRGLWPSNSGNNFVQLMIVELFEKGRKNAIGTGWATPQSRRVGFGIGDELPGGQEASGRCKIPQ